MSLLSKNPSSGDTVPAALYANAAAFPATGYPGSLAVALDTFALYILNATTGLWTLVGPAASASDPLAIHRDNSQPPTANITWATFSLLEMGDLFFSNATTRSLQMTDNNVADGNSVNRLIIRGGNKTAGSGTGGSLAILAGSSVGNQGGTLSVTGGAGVSGGSVTVTGGSASGGGAGSTLTLAGGGTTGAGTAGLVILKGGRSTGGGLAGEVQLRTGNSAGSTQRFTVDANGSVAMGTAALATSATDGFFYLNTSAGAPIGVPTTKTGRVPLHYDTSGSSLYAYNGSWLAIGGGITQLTGDVSAGPGTGSQVATVSAAIARLASPVFTGNITTPAILTTGDAIKIGNGSVGAGGTSVSIGFAAGFNQAEDECTFVGYGAGYHPLGSGAGAQNSYFGQRSGFGMGLGAHNTYIGSMCAGTNIAKDGDGNTGLGDSAFLLLTDGANNTALGRNAGNALTTGDRNIIIGFDADVSGPTVDDELALGTFLKGDTALLRVSGARQLVLETTATPASTAATGTTGTIVWDSSFLYVCVATDTWVRTALTTW